MRNINKDTNKNKSSAKKGKKENGKAIKQEEKKNKKIAKQNKKTGRQEERKAMNLAKQNKKNIKRENKQLAKEAKIKKRQNKKSNKQNKNIFNWRKLDNSAKIFPLSTGTKYSTVFRLSAVLKENVDKKFLNKAVNQTLLKYDFFQVKMKRGFFWYYLEHNNKLPIIGRGKGISLQIYKS